MSEAHRFRISVPLSDASSLEWIQRQDDVSASVRFLIRESIARVGMIDPLCAPVVQQPRRGRPPTLAEEGVQELAENGAGGYYPRHEVVPEVVPTTATPPPVKVAPVPAPEPDPEPEQDGAAGVDSFFTHGN